MKLEGCCCGGLVKAGFDSCSAHLHDANTAAVTDATRPAAAGWGPGGGGLSGSQRQLLFVLMKREATGGCGGRALEVI